MPARRRWLATVTAAVGLWGAFVAVSGRADVPAPPADGGEAGAAAEGTPAPQFVLPTANAALCGLESFSTRRYVGATPDEPRKALVVSFAASYCVPCRKELPELKALAEQRVADGVGFVVVAVDRDEEGQEAVRRLLVDELRLPFPAVLDRFGIVGRRYGAAELPLLVVVGPDGVVRWRRAGYHEDSLARLGEQLDTLAPRDAVAPGRGGAGGTP